MVRGTIVDTHFFFLTQPPYTFTKLRLQQDIEQIPGNDGSEENNCYNHGNKFFFEDAGEH